MAAVDETLLQEDPIASEACDRISAWYRRAARDLWTTLAPPGGVNYLVVKVILWFLYKEEKQGG